jgi:hypothetical protein
LVYEYQGFFAFFAGVLKEEVNIWRQLEIMRFQYHPAHMSAGSAAAKPDLGWAFY